MRECGPCTACCTVLAVPELEKGTYQACGHLCEAGCGIYADRPGSCRTFECEWLRGMLEIDGSVDTDLRPDACGVIFEYRPDTPFGEMYTAWEVEPGASASGHARSVIEGLQETFLVAIMTRHQDGREWSDRRLVGPSNLVTRASDTMWSRRRDVG